MSLKPLQVEESAVGTGGLCGSAFLNYRFEEHVRNRLGHSRFDEMQVKKSKTWQMGLRYFEEFVKRNFNEDEHQEVNVPCVQLPCPPLLGFWIRTDDYVASLASPMTRKSA
jgi:hypothetical protein